MFCIQIYLQESPDSGFRLYSSVKGGNNVSNGNFRIDKIVSCLKYILSHRDPRIPVLLEILNLNYLHRSSKVFFKLLKSVCVCWITDIRYEYAHMYALYTYLAFFGFPKTPTLFHFLLSWFSKKYGLCAKEKRFLPINLPTPLFNRPKYKIHISKPDTIHHFKCFPIMFLKRTNVLPMICANISSEKKNSSIRANHEYVNSLIPGTETAKRWGPSKNTHHKQIAFIGLHVM